MQTKAFKLPADDLRDLAPGRGACYATDHITVDGKPVGYMYRESPDTEKEYKDSGWRFFSGEETQEYVDDAENIMIYDLNTIANCDRAIIEYLDAPIGSQWERVLGSNSFREVQD